MHHDPWLAAEVLNVPERTHTFHPAAEDELDKQNSKWCCGRFNFYSPPPLPPTNIST